jgi:hypothetical protein
LVSAGELPESADGWLFWPPEGWRTDGKMDGNYLGFARGSGR